MQKLRILSIRDRRGFSESSVGKESVCYAGDPSSIPRSERSPGEGKGYPLQYSGLENSMGVTKSRTGLSDFHFLFQVRTIQLTSLPQKQGPSTRKTLPLWYY